MLVMSKIISTIVIYASLMLQAGTAYAASLCPAGFESLCKLDPESNPGGISNAVSSFISVIIILAIILSLIFLVFGGIKWITSGGDKQKLDAARQHLTAAIVGLVISLLAYFIVGILLGLFGLSTKDLKLPKLV
jgi:uncharacterized protein YacL